MDLPDPQNIPWLKGVNLHVSSEVPDFRANQACSASTAGREVSRTSKLSEQGLRCHCEP